MRCCGGSHQQTPTVRLGRLQFDTATRMVLIDDQPLALTKRELAVLEAPGSTRKTGHA